MVLYGTAISSANSSSVRDHRRALHRPAPRAHRLDLQREIPERKLAAREHPHQLAPAVNQLPVAVGADGPDPLELLGIS